MRRSRSRRLATGAEIVTVIREHWEFDDIIEGEDPDAMDAVVDYMLHKRVTEGDLTSPTFRVAVIGNLYMYETWRKAR